MLKTDASFCCSAEVQRIMEIRRRHGECKKDGGRECEVFVGRRCEVLQRGGMGKGRRFMKKAWSADEKSIVILSALILALAVVLLWMRGLMLGKSWPLAQLFLRSLLV